MKKEVCPDCNRHFDPTVGCLCTATDSGSWLWHPRFSKWDWAHEAKSLATRLGYWDWVKSQLECER